MNLNKVFLIGNLTRDPERRSLPSGQPVVSFGLATNRFYKNQQGERQQETEFHNITVFGRLAEIASQYLQKGSSVFIEGRIRTRNWQDANGIKHYRTEIITESLQLGPRLGGFSREKIQNNIDTGHQSLSEEEIPVIEQEPINKPTKSSENPIDEPEEKEIDVKNIPF